MSDTVRIRPEIRRLWAPDTPELIDHFLRLDAETRRLRFGGVVSDRFVRDYSTHILSDGSVVFGAFPDGALRGIAELRGVLDSKPRCAEAALLVEPAWQDGGIGDALLNRLIAAAQNRGIHKLCMMCLRENRRMQNLAKKHNAHLEVDIENVEAALAPPWPTPMSMFEEVFGDTRSYIYTMFQHSK